LKKKYIIEIKEHPFNYSKINIRIRQYE